MIKNQTQEALHQIDRKIEDHGKEVDTGKNHSLTVNLNRLKIIILSIKVQLDAVGKILFQGQNHLVVINPKALRIPKIVFQMVRIKDKIHQNHFASIKGVDQDQEKISDLNKMIKKDIPVLIQ